MPASRWFDSHITVIAGATELTLKRLIIHNPAVGVALSARTGQKRRRQGPQLPCIVFPRRSEEASLVSHRDESSHSPRLISSVVITVRARERGEGARAATQLLTVSGAYLPGHRELQPADLPATNRGRDRRSAILGFNRRVRLVVEIRRSAGNAAKLTGHFFDRRQRKSSVAFSPRYAAIFILSSKTSRHVLLVFQVCGTNHKMAVEEWR